MNTWSQAAFDGTVVAKATTASTLPLVGVFGKARRGSHRVIDGILSMVDAGVLCPQRSLPPERELARRFHVGRRAVRAALRTLIDGGIVAVDRGGRLVVAATGTDPSLAALVRTRRLLSA